jgi:hypothetical protein
MRNGSYILPLLLSFIWTLIIKKKSYMYRLQNNIDLKYLFYINSGENWFNDGHWEYFCMPNLIKLLYNLYYRLISTVKSLILACLTTKYIKCHYKLMSSIRWVKWCKSRLTSWKRTSKNESWHGTIAVVIGLL